MSDRRKKEIQLRYAVLAALFAAMIYVLTAFVHIPTQQGYIHIGDALICIAAALLPAPYAVCAAAIGAGMSDFLSGYAIWVLPTVIIKSATALMFTSKNEKMLCRRNWFASMSAMLICVGGYYIAGGILYGDFIAALADIPTNIIQTVASIALFVSTGAAMDKMQIKRRLVRN